MEAVLFVIGLVLGYMIGGEVPSKKVKALERKKAELSAMYYTELEKLNSDLALANKKLSTYESMLNTDQKE